MCRAQSRATDRDWLAPEEEGQVEASAVHREEPGRRVQLRHELLLLQVVREL
jgi:hypothetical protein